MAAKIIATTENAHALMQAMAFTYTPSYAIPPSISLWWIDASFSTEVALTAKIEGVCRGILDQYGFIVYNLVRDPDWKTHSLLAPLVGKIIDTGLVHCSFRGCIMDFNKIAHHDLLNLLRDQVPVHYQWFPTDIGPLDPRTLKATDYDDFNRETYHTREMKTDEKQHGEIKKPGQAAKVVKGEALFYKMSKKGRNKTLISRAEYNRISQSCHVVRLNLLTGEVCTVFEDEQIQTRHEETPAVAGTPVVTLGVTNTVPVDSEVQAETPHKQTQTQTCREEMPAVVGMPVVTLGVTNTVPSEIQAETPHKQTCMVVDTQALVLPNIKNMNTQNAPGLPPVPPIVSLPRQSSHCQFLPHPPILIPNALPSNEGLQLIRSAYGEDM
ncbi:hypothetical protein BDR06DRAFT_1014721 [Suillus hirtellus]|nr:hypothetical protein BDR06DRAFT_1014721 [Suillus hirtellus]